MIDIGKLNIKKEVVHYPCEEVSDPKVSIVVPTYNHGKYISQCLDSLLSQETTFRYEILLGEDDSNDNTREICIDYANKNIDKIRLFLHNRENVIKINGNPSGRFNLLYSFGLAKGKYIAICDGDDFWIDPYKLQKQVDFMEANSDYALCFTRTNYLKNNHLELQKFPIERSDGDYDLKDFYFYYNFICTASVLFKRFEIPKSLLNLSYGDLSIYTIVSKNKKIKCLDFEGAVYRIHENGVWQGKTRRKQILMGLHFYKEIFLQVDSEIKKIIKLKSIVLMEELINVEYKNRFLKGIYYRFLKFKFFPKN